MSDESDHKPVEDTDEPDSVAADHLDEFGDMQEAPDPLPSFSTAFRGYNTDEVDRFLTEIIQRDAVLAERADRLQAELDAERLRGGADAEAQRARYEAEIQGERARHETERAQLESVRASLEARVVALEHELERLRGELDATRSALPEIESLRTRLETLTATYEERVSALDALVPYVIGELRTGDEESGETDPEASFAEVLRPDDKDVQDEPDVAHPMAHPADDRPAGNPPGEAGPHEQAPASFGSGPERAGDPDPEDVPEDVLRGDWERDPADDAGGPASRGDADDAIGWEQQERPDAEEGTRPDDEEGNGPGTGVGPSTPD